MQATAGLRALEGVGERKRRLLVSLGKVANKRESEKERL